MQINLIADSSVSSAPAGFTTMVQAAANLFDAAIPGNYTVNITYGWGTYDGTVDDELNGSNSAAFSLGGFDNGEYLTYAQAKALLTSSATSLFDKEAVASLPASYTSLPDSTNTILLSSAEEKALGVYTGGASTVDGSIGFNTVDASDPLSYIEEAAICELGHALGWFSGYETPGQYASLMDLYRFSAPGVYAWQGGQAEYLSINDGKTDLANFATSFDYTLLDNAGPTEPFDVPFPTGVTPALTSLDLEGLSLLGFGSGPAPETVNVSTYVQNHSTLDTTTNGLIIQDSASAVAGAFATIAADSVVLSIDLTDSGVPVLALTDAEASSDAGTLAKIVNTAFEVTAPGETAEYYVGGNGQSATAIAETWSSHVVTERSGSNVSVTGSGDTITLGSNDTLSLSATSNVFDAVTGSSAQIALANAQAAISGGANVVALDGSSSDFASLYKTQGAWDTVSGSHGVIGLTQAQAAVHGGGDTVYLDGSSTDFASLFGTNSVWDTVSGSAGSVGLTAAQADISGGNDTVWLDGSTSDFASLSKTGGAWDGVNGSNGQIGLTQAQAAITGGDDKIWLDGATNDFASLYATAGTWDTVVGSNGSVGLTQAWATIEGGGDTVWLDGSTSDFASLNGTGSSADTVNGSNGVIGLTNAEASLTGSNDTVYFAGSSNSLAVSGGSEILAFGQTIGLDTVSGFVASDVIDLSHLDFANWSALQPKIAQSGLNTTIKLDANDEITLTGVTAANLTSSEFKFV